MTLLRKPQLEIISSLYMIEAAKDIVMLMSVSFEQKSFTCNRSIFDIVAFLLLLK